VKFRTQNAALHLQGYSNEAFHLEASKHEGKGQTTPTSSIPDCIDAVDWRRCVSRVLLNQGENHQNFDVPALLAFRHKQKAASLSQRPQDTGALKAFQGFVSCQFSTPLTALQEKQIPRQQKG
jgi:hypothetical protein